MASVGTGAALHIESNGVNKTGSIPVPDTANWLVYTDLVKSNISLQPGVQVLKVVFDTASPSTACGDLNWFTLTPSATNAPAMRLRVGLSKTVLADIRNGQPAPVAFGSVRAGAKAPVRTFTITNSGRALPMTLGKIKLPKGYVLLNKLPKTLAAGASAAFKVRLSTAKAGTYAGAVIIPTSVAGDTAFSFPVSGLVNKAKKKAPHAMTAAPIAATAAPAIFTAAPAQTCAGASPRSYVGLFSTRGRRLLE